jgi:hypothetical protein
MTNRKRTDNIMTNRKGTENIMTNRKRTDNIMTNRKRTDNIISNNYINLFFTDDYSIINQKVDFPSGAPVVIPCC